MSVINTAKIKQNAKSFLKGKWGEVVPFTIIFILSIVIIQALSSASIYFGFLITFILYPPIIVGYYKYFLSFTKGETSNFKILFSPFKENYGQSFITYLLYSVYILLWALLLVIPGIIKTFAYSQVFFIIAEDNEISANNALKKSEAMMRGHKMELFVLMLRFILWYLLGIITFGIGFLWGIPYMLEAETLFYKEVKRQYEESLI